MNNIFTITSREFYSRVKNPMFLRLLVLVPLTIAVSFKFIQKYSAGGGGDASGAVLQNNIFGYIGSYMIFFAIVMFGTQVMKSVVEEKSSKLAELLLSSVKPFELLSGKIIGVGFSGLLQFLGWVLLSGVFVILVSPMEFKAVFQFHLKPSEVLGLVYFLAYFILGYFLYSAVFASIAAATDGNTDIQQLVFPITLPLFLPLIFKDRILNNPESAMSIWLSNIPFTSPIVMINRMAAGEVPALQIISSLFCLVIGIIIVSYLAGKIYQSKILTQGSKFNLFNLFKG